MTQAPTPRKRAEKKRPIRQWARSTAKPEDPFAPGQDVLVITNDAPLDCLPCMPYPGEAQPICEVPNKAWITYKGLTDVCGDYLMEFDYDGTRVLLGTGVAGYLKNVPKRGKPRKRR